MCVHAHTHVCTWAHSGQVDTPAERADEQVLGVATPSPHGRGLGVPVPALQRALQAAAEHTLPFVSRGSLAHPARAHFLLEAVGGPAPGHHVPGTKGPFMPTSQLLLWPLQGGSSRPGDSVPKG